jgi:hypothetical protein
MLHLQEETEIAGMAPIGGGRAAAGRAFLPVHLAG